MTATDLYTAEHAAGLHRRFLPSGCGDCATAIGSRQPIASGPGRDTEPQAAARTAAAAVIHEAGGLRRLSDVIVDLRARGKGFGDGQPPAPEPLESADRNPWCDRCRGARWLRIEYDRRPSEYRRCPDCLHAQWAVQQRVDRLLGTLPPLFANCRLDTFPTADANQRRAVDLVRSWLDDASPSWLFLWGPTGRGKTGLAVGVLHELALRGNSTALRNVPDLLSTIKSTFGEATDESESQVLDVLSSVDVLCLDDLGSEYHRGNSDWASEKVFQIVAARHAGLKRTIVTSNYSLDQLQDRLGHPRTLRRIVDMTGSRWILDFRRMPSIGTELS